MSHHQWAFKEGGVPVCKVCGVARNDDPQYPDNDKEYCNGPSKPKPLLRQLTAKQFDDQQELWRQNRQKHRDMGRDQ